MTTEGPRHLDPVTLTQELIRIPSDKNELGVISYLTEIVSAHL